MVWFYYYSKWQYQGMGLHGITERILPTSKVGSFLGWQLMPNLCPQAGCGAALSGGQESQRALNVCAKCSTGLAEGKPSCSVYPQFIAPYKGRLAISFTANGRLKINHRCWKAIFYILQAYDLFSCPLQTEKWPAGHSLRVPATQLILLHADIN